MNEELTRRIVNELARQHNRNDIIQMVCEGSSMNWGEAEQFVKNVESEHAHAIVRKQSPLMIILSIGSVLMGIILVYLAADYLMGYFRGQAVEQLLSARTGLYRMAAGLTGIGMIVGGAIGLYDAVFRFFQT